MAIEVYMENLVHQFDYKMTVSCVSWGILWLLTACVIEAVNEFRINSKLFYFLLKTWELVYFYLQLKDSICQIIKWMGPNYFVFVKILIFIFWLEK